MTIAEKEEQNSLNQYIYTSSIMPENVIQAESTHFLNYTKSINNTRSVCKGKDDEHPNFCIQNSISQKQVMVNEDGSIISPDNKFYCQVYEQEKSFYKECDNMDQNQLGKYISEFAGKLLGSHNTLKSLDHKEYFRKGWCPSILQNEYFSNESIPREDYNELESNQF